jgi:hypothetical protein
MNFKEKLLNTLGTGGYILYYIISLVISTFPVVMMGLPIWVDFILIGIMLFLPSTSMIFWIIGLIFAIIGTQDVIAIIYYILFAILVIPKIITIISILIRKD